MSILEALETELDAAQNELELAELASIEAAARRKAAADTAARLKAAVAALKGEAPAPQAPKTEAAPVPAEKPRPKPAADPNDPYALLKCAGCGTVGSTRPAIIQTKSGARQILACTSCGNQSI